MIIFSVETGMNIFIPTARGRGSEASRTKGWGA
jgi:hypothetical protein